MNKISIPLLLLTLICVVPMLSAQEATFQVIVHPDNPTTTLPASQVAKLFLKQVTSWSHGGKVQPVDLDESAPARIAFSEEILGRSVAAVESYWQQQIYSGRSVPPVKVRTDAEVVAYVKANPTAIGYVSRGASTDGVKIVQVD